MKTPILSACLLGLILSPAAQAQKGAEQSPAPAMVTPPPAVYQAPAAMPVEASGNTYEQKLYDSPTLIPRAEAEAIASHFSAAYPKMGNPRFLIFVNRELVDEQSGVRLVGRTETTEASRGGITSKFEADTNAVAGSGSNTVNITAGGNVVMGGGVHNADDGRPGKGKATAHGERVTNQNTYRVQDRATLSVVERQAVRDVERLFGSQFRSGGASLVDQRIATQLMGDKPLQSFSVPTEGEAARKDREAIGKIADVVVEVLLSYRNVTVTKIAGEKVVTIPEIHATAIQLKDSQILGQASSADVIIHAKGANRRHFTESQIAEATSIYTERELAEATALTLMDDVVRGVK